MWQWAFVLLTTAAMKGLSRLISQKPSQAFPQLPNYAIH
jgi:hypothetical protein